jgi:hypothetical protein
MISEALELLKFDLQRGGVELGDEVYLMSLLYAAEQSLTRQGLQPCDDYDYIQAVVGTAAWMYRKRINGESEPAYLRRLRLDLLSSQKMRSDDYA